MGSGKILNIESIGKLLVKVKQKDGSEYLLVLKNVHYVPNLYCNIFSITLALEEGFELSGGKKEPLTLRKDHVNIKFYR